MMQLGRDAKNHVKPSIVNKANVNSPKIRMIKFTANYTNSLDYLNSLLSGKLTCGKLNFENITKHDLQVTAKWTQA